MAKKQERVWIILKPLGEGAVFHVRLGVPHSRFYMDSSEYWLTRADAQAAADKFYDKMVAMVTKDRAAARRP